MFFCTKLFCIFCDIDWYMGPSKWPQHDRQPEREDNQRLRLVIQSVLDCLHHPGTVSFN